MQTHHKKHALALIILSTLGALVSSYLVYQHYKPLGDAICNINNYVNCDIVNKSEYAEILGIPVAALGLAAYVVIFFVSLTLLRGWFKHAAISLAVFTAGGLVFSLYLTIVEFFVLHAVCLFCLASQAIILALFIISLLVWLKSRAYS